MKTPDAVLIRAAELSERVYSESTDYLCDLTMPGYVFLAVEGTKEKTDWITNIKFLFKDADRHRGFLSNAERTFTDFYCAGGSLPEDRLLVLAGHSLGGATATMLAEMLVERFPDLTLVTFGSPRPGGRGFRTRMTNINHHRFVHGNDVVPKTPPYLAGYVHTTDETYLADSDDSFADGVSDHNISDYKIALEKKVRHAESNEN